MDETGARVLLWEAQPPEEARAVIRGLGFADVVFPTLATTPAGSDYVVRFRAAVDDLAEALGAVDG